MPLVDATELLRHPSYHGYAVCSLELAGLDFLAMTVPADESFWAPAVLGVAEPHLEHLAVEYLLPTVEAGARHASVPVAIQFIRAASVAPAVRAIGLGCNSIALMGSGRVPEEHVPRIRAVIEAAHTCGVAVEDGLNAVGHLLGELPAPFDAFRRYVERTGADVLTVADGRFRPLAPDRLSLDFEEVP